MGGTPLAFGTLASELGALEVALCRRIRLMSEREPTPLA